jgi:hypothetical protein
MVGGKAAAARLYLENAKLTLFTSDHPSSRVRARWRRDGEQSPRNGLRFATLSRIVKHSDVAIRVDAVEKGFLTMDTADPMHALKILRMLSRRESWVRRPFSTPSVLHATLLKVLLRFGRLKPAATIGKARSSFIIPARLVHFY